MNRLILIIQPWF